MDEAHHERPPTAEDVESLETRIERRYAHFHRVLGDLLLRLGREADTFWLVDARHRVTDASQPNEYARAVYVIEDLAPYETVLSELERVQAEALRLIGNGRPTQALLMPKVCRNVREARILENTGFASRARKRSDVLDRLLRQRAAAEVARERLFGFRDRADTVAAIERELRELEAGIASLQSKVGDTLREHYRYVRHMCHVYYRAPAGAFDQLYVGDVGVILQGESPEVHRHDPRRRKHRRTPGIEPLASIGPYVYYDEAAWREARARA